MYVCEYDQEIAQSHTADQHIAPRGRSTEYIITISYIFDESLSFDGYALYGRPKLTRG